LHKSVARLNDDRSAEFLGVCVGHLDPAGST
jgi:hypothetical protein